ncbi:unnamed protein product, partial [Scytosiphon promiscuus]
MGQIRAARTAALLAVATGRVPSVPVSGVFVEVPLTSNNEGGQGSNSSGGRGGRGGASSSFPPPSWTLSNSNGSIVVPAGVPGAVHLDLLEAGVLDAGDPYFGTNELTYSWVALEDWTYVLTLPRESWGGNIVRGNAGGGGEKDGSGRVEDGFHGAGSFAAAAATEEAAAAAAAAAVGLLTFEGIDTFATVRVNGREVGRSSNSFMPATFVLREDCLSELLTNQVSTVEVTLRSALVEARDRAAAAASGPNPPPDSLFFGDWAEPAHRNFARKAASDFGWDWGPAFAPAGLPGAVSLTVTSTGRLLQDVAVAQGWGKRSPSFPPSTSSPPSSSSPPPPPPLPPSSPPARVAATAAVVTDATSTPEADSVHAASAGGAASPFSHAAFGAAAAAAAPASSFVAADKPTPVATDATATDSSRDDSFVPRAPPDSVPPAADTPAAGPGVVEVTLTAFLDGFDVCRASIDEKECGGGAKSGIEKLDEDGGRPQKETPGGIFSAKSSSTAAELGRKGVVFFSLFEPGEEDASGGGEGEKVAEACTALVLPPTGGGCANGADDITSGHGDGDGGCGGDDCGAIGDDVPVVDEDPIGGEQSGRRKGRGASLRCRRGAGEPVPVRGKVTVSNPKLWWPRGMGGRRPHHQQQQEHQQRQQQRLYMLRVDWYPGTDVSCPPVGVPAATQPAAAAEAPRATAADAAAQDGGIQARVVAGAEFGVDRARGDAAVAPQSTVWRKVGLREVEIVREPLTLAGATGAPAAAPAAVMRVQRQAEDAATPSPAGSAGGIQAGPGKGTAEGASGAGEDSPSTAATLAEARIRLEGIDPEMPSQEEHRRRVRPAEREEGRDSQKQDGGDAPIPQGRGVGTDPELVGETMYFRVNGVPVFARGSNYVPPDAWGQRVSERKRRWLLESAAAANMNMIRVWGGGRTQPRSFYSACDELGLMVWQDLPYACALYPVTDAPPPPPNASHGPDGGDAPGDVGGGGADTSATDGRVGWTTITAAGRRVSSERAIPLREEQGGAGAFAARVLEDAAAEAIAFVRRLSAHPSVVCWGGNNEVEQALGWFNESSSDPGRKAYEQDYVTLFVDTIGNAVRSVDPFTPFVDSSPTNGLVAGVAPLPLEARPGTAAASPTRASAGAATTVVDESELRAPEARRGSAPPPAAGAGAGAQAGPHPPGALEEPGGGAGEVVARESGLKRWGNPNDPRYGDVHFYDYDMDCEDGGGYPNAMFVSEHGVQSFPSLDSYKQVTNPEDRWLGSPAMAFRQRHEGGNEQISRQMRKHFNFRLSPEEERQLGRERAGGGRERADEEALRAYLKLSQIQQGRCLEAAIGSWRRGRRHGKGEKVGFTSSSSSGGGVGGSRSGDNSTENKKKGDEIGDESKSDDQIKDKVEQGGEVGREGTAPAGLPEMEAAAGTMGVLYWQLADTWQGPSWSTIEYDGSWKVSHHMVRRAFSSPLAVTGTVTTRLRVAEGKRTPPADIVGDVMGARDLRDGGDVGDEGVGGDLPDVETLWFESHVTSDLLGGIQGSYSVSVYRWDDRCDPVASWGGELYLPARGSAKVFEAPVRDMRSAAGAERLIVHMVFEEGGGSGGQGRSDDNHGDCDGDEDVEKVFERRSGDATRSSRRPMSADDLPEPGLSWEILTGSWKARLHAEERCKFTVRVRARAHAAHVTLGLENQSLERGDQHDRSQRAPLLAPPTPSFHAADGGFHVFPCKARDIRVRFYRARDCEDAGLSSAIRVESLKELLGAIEAGKRPSGHDEGGSRTG